MENVTHLWNVTSFLMKFNDKSINNLRNYYVNCCRQQERFFDLPNNCFGPSVMCSHCGSFWSKVKHKNRLLPSKLPKKNLKLDANDNSSSKFRSSLARKCQRGKMNKLQIKCSVCSKYTTIPRNKPIKIKSPSKVDLNTTEILQSGKKKKKRTKDKTAGLNISLSDSFNSASPNKISTPLQKERKETVRTITPLGKVKKINKDRLSNILSSDSAKKRNSLTNFLKELY
ncbi:uncharacterized protein LOC122511494 [Leptopilina heterotoma]|uniref:uncharacterized protein LOC122511494 n=1 Tax=Leptopilina heterotoma TaxID=63436 RepID=UPI001CA8DD31|nr:uncharacterized protein LOC122511494 [Leptopilina heterotoma]